MKRSKKYVAVLKNIDKSKKYDAAEALKLMPTISTSKFAGSVEVQVVLNLTDKQKKEAVRGTYALPNAFGKSIKILAFAEANAQKDAKDADVVGAEELIPDIEAGKVTFDLVITTPAMMPKIARLGKVLGSKGLMPNPRNGTITTDLAGTIAKFKAGQKNFKMNDTARIIGVIGKTDMETAKLVENFDAFVKAIFGEVKKYGTTPIKAISMSPTMGPKVNVDVAKISF